MPASEDGEWSNFGKRLDWARRQIVPVPSERAFAENVLHLKSATHIWQWREPDSKSGRVRYPQIDIAIQIWDNLNKVRSIDLLWLLSGRGQPSPTISGTLEQALANGPPRSRAVRSAAIAFWELTRPALDEREWTILLDQWAEVEQEGKRLAGASSSREESDEDPAEYFTGSGLGTKLVPRPKKLRRR